MSRDGELVRRMPADVMQVIKLDDIEGVLEEILEAIRSTTPYGDVTGRVVQVSGYERVDLMAYSVSIYNDGPDEVYIGVNRPALRGEAVPVLKAGEDINVDMRRRDGIRFLSLRTDDGKTATVRIAILR